MNAEQKPTTQLHIYGVRDPKNPTDIRTEFVALIPYFIRSAYRHPQGADLGMTAQGSFVDPTPIFGGESDMGIKVNRRHTQTIAAQLFQRKYGSTSFEFQYVDPSNFDTSRKYEGRDYNMMVVRAKTSLPFPPKTIDDVVDATNPK